MVHFSDCDPRTLHAYSLIPLTPETSSSVHQDFDIGSYARFRDPAVVLQIHDRPEFHGLSTLQIRERLDRENLTDAFGLIDQETADSHAIWWVESTEGSAYDTESFTEGGYPPISYANESAVVWRLRLKTAALPLQWVNWDIANTDLTDDIAKTTPYDPHDPQTVPYTLGVDFADPVEGRSFLPGAYVTANSTELEWSDDLEPRRIFLPMPPGVIRLTAEAATGAGLLSSWYPTYEGRPQPGQDVPIQQQYDWNSPKWAANNTLGSALPKRRLSSPKPAPELAVCQRNRVYKLSNNRTESTAGTRLPASSTLTETS